MKNMYSLNSSLLGTPKRIISKLWNSFKARPIEILGLIATIVALQLTRTSNQMTKDSLDVSKQGVIQADSQFKENNKSQDEQDRQTREQHDSLMAVLKQQKNLLDQQLISLKQQNKVTSQNLAITKSQLNFTKELQQRQIEEERGLLVAGNIEIQDTGLMVNNLHHPLILFDYVNKGKREVSEYELHLAVISKQWKIFTKKTSKGINPLGNSISVTSRLTTGIDNINNFYYFTNLIYKDVITQKVYSTEYFYNYSSIRGVYKFYECTQDEKNKIQAVLLADSAEKWKE